MGGERAVDAALNGLPDIDLAFTPASNTNAIRRLSLSDGETADSAAVWLDTADWTIKPLPQTYRRMHAGAYHYTSPLHGYSAVLTVEGFGIVTDYPGLWAAVS